MPNLWFRFYSEFEDDPKVQMMPEAMQCRLVKVFCSRCKESRLTDAQRAFKWRISLGELAETKVLFLDQGFIDDQWNPIAWNRRQFLSDSSTERVRKHRQGLKQDETLHETKRNVTVTPDSVSVSVSVSDSVSGIPVHSVAKEVCAKLKFTHDLIFRAVAEQARLEVGEECEPDEADALVERMSKAWLSYIASIPKLAFIRKAQDFYSEGMWRDQTAWPWKAELNGHSRADKVSESVKRMMAKED